MNFEATEEYSVCHVVLKHNKILAAEITFGNISAQIIFTNVSTYLANFIYVPRKLLVLERNENK